MIRLGKVGRSKWTKWNCLNKSDYVSIHLPYTERYSYTALQSFLQRYPLVFVKPDGLSLGKNVICLKRNGEAITAQLGKKVRTFSSYEKLHQWINSIRKHSFFIIQQGIDLARYEGRPVDMRSVIIKNERGEWEVTAHVAKRAGKGLMITNHAAGGEILTINQYLLALGLNKEQRMKFYQNFSTLSKEAGRQLGKQYDNYIYGLDIGMDKYGKLWILEANTKPDNRFLKHYNKNMYKRTNELIKYNRHHQKSFLALKKSN